MKRFLISLILVLFLAAPVLAEITYTYTWVNATAAATAPTTCVGDNATCLSGGIISVKPAYNISYHCDSVTDTNHTAADWDINFHLAATSTGVWTSATKPYYEKKGLVADDVFGGELTPPRLGWMKLTLDENAAQRADVTCIIKVFKKYE
jgi:hypothetical protein